MRPTEEICSDADSDLRTGRLERVMFGLASGLTGAEIAEKLGINDNTVSRYRGAIKDADSTTIARAMFEIGSSRHNMALDSFTNEENQHSGFKPEV